MADVKNIRRVKARVRNLLKLLKPVRSRQRCQSTTLLGEDCWEQFLPYEQLCKVCKQGYEYDYKSESYRLILQYLRDL